MQLKSKLSQLFLELAKPDEDGYSRKVYVREFEERYAPLKLGNGGSWCRDDGPLAHVYNIERAKSGNKISYIKLHGFEKRPIKKPIPDEISQAIKRLRCSVLDIGSVEVDHKDGRRDDLRLQSASSVKIDDFQPLSKAANNAKRSHCKRCRDSNDRFDATALGFPLGQWKRGSKI
ncbi:MAG: hypothetical protein ACN4E2_04630 [Nitrospinota bacterium]